MVTRIMLRNRVLQIGFIVWAGFWPIAWLLQDRPDLLFEVVNALVIATGLGVAVAYCRGARDSMNRPQRMMQGGHFLVLGIFGFALATSVETAWRWVWRATDDAWMLNSPFLAFMMYVGASALALHLVAKDAIDGQIPAKSWLQLGITTAAAIAIFLLSLALIISR